MAAFAFSRLFGCGVIAAGALLSGCTPMPAAVGQTSLQRACFFPDQVSNFRQDGTQTVYVRSFTSGVFELTSSGFCRDLDNANALGIAPLTGSSSRLCVGDFATVSTSASISPATPCRVRVTRKLTAEQLAALPDRYRP